MRHALLVIAGVGLGCGSAATSQLRSVTEDNRSIKNDLDSINGAVNGSRAFVADAATGNPNALYLQYSAADLQNMAARMVPYTIPARDIDSQMTGEIIVERVSDFAFAPGNQLGCKLHLRGNNVKYTGFVPAGYQAQLKAYQSAMANGWIADLAVELFLNASSLSARANTTRVQFKGPADRSMESRVKQAMNERALKGAIFIDVALPGWQPQHVFLTSTHAMVGYRR